MYENIINDYVKMYCRRNERKNARSKRKNTSDSIGKEKHMNIYEKLSKISNELSTVAKNLSVGEGKAKYKAVGEADVLKAIKPLEEKYKVYSYPSQRRIIESGFLDTVNYKGEPKKQFYERIEVIYKFVNIEEPNEYIEITTYGDGIDSGDKSVGKAMTYADKYALLKAYKIVTGDDQDQEPSGELEGVKIELDKRLLSQAQELGIDLEKVAIYLKKNVKSLTNEDLRNCINTKLRCLEKEPK